MQTSFIMIHPLGSWWGSGVGGMGSTQRAFSRLMFAWENSYRVYGLFWWLWFLSPVLAWCPPESHHQSSVLSPLSPPVHCFCAIFTMKQSYRRVRMWEMDFICDQMNCDHRGRSRITSVMFLGRIYGQKTFILKGVSWFHIPPSCFPVASIKKNNSYCILKEQMTLKTHYPVFYLQ